ncbi:AAA family ATPase [Salinicoccus sp. HZC-1]|uniref:AAA family ATPase n=1 Tax=Salinicoccus sp. HZC-1 TaxID=3385497 RepID=UPI00398A9A91
MINELDLSFYSDRFHEMKLEGLKQKNFVYGKNGTGKSSITEAIKNNHSTEYDIHLFDGYKRVFGENERLDAIALGEKNKEVQTKIEELNSTIKELSKDLREPVNDEENTYSRHRDSLQDYLKIKENIEEYFTKCASEIKNRGNPQVASPTYNKQSFKEDMNKVSKISKDEIRKYEKTIKEDRKDIEVNLKLPVINGEEIQEEINGLLTTSIKPTKIINELESDHRKQSFAREGMKVHSHRDSNGNLLHEESCAFCGNTISELRWSELDDYFSESFKKHEEDMSEKINEIDVHIERINDVEKINKNDFYLAYEEEINELNAEIFDYKNNTNEFLRKLKRALKYKLQNIFEESKEMELSTQNNGQEILNKYNQIVEENIKLSQNIEQRKKEARDKIRWHIVNLYIESSDYKELHDHLNVSKGRKIEIETYLNDLQENLNKLKNEKSELVNNSKSNVIATENINKLLNGLGNCTFTLEHVEEEGEQRGQYRVKGIDGSLRSVAELSEGEKNILAFLYFLNKLEDVDQNTEYDKGKIIIFDDPMTSNDDNVQYLMIGALQKLYEQQNHPQLFVLTHNNHFYLQMCPNKRKYDKQNYLRLIKMNEKTEFVKITEPKDDLKPLYHELWEELKFAYENDKTTFMWNNMRRILEAFNRFVYGSEQPRDIERNIGEFEGKILAVSLIKSLHVNSHIGYETDVDISGKSKEELLEVFKKVFEAIKFESHFKVYWG